MVLKWGICCAGKICNDFVGAQVEFGDLSNEIKAVAARDINRAREFAERFKIEKYFDSYEQLAQLSEIDIVYIGAIHSEHCHLAKLFLSHGKHVLVEKPMAMNVAETKEMIDFAREKKLFLMEGIWSLCFPLYKQIQDVILNGDIGKVKHLNANFQIKIDNSDRVWKKELGGGGILDIGLYVIQIALWIFHGRNIVRATSDLKKENDVDTCGTFILEFDHDSTAFLTYHTKQAGDTSATIYGETGKIEIPKYMWCPEEAIFNGKLDQSKKLHRKNEAITYNFGNSWYLIHEINHVSSCIQQGLLESNIHPLDASLKLAELIEQLSKK